jgi:rubrerythrin
MTRLRDPDPAVLGHLDDGTAYYAPLGQMVYDADEDRVQCHLRGEWFRTVGGPHLLRAHGWTTAEYRDRFGLVSKDARCARGTSATLRRQTNARIASGELSSRPSRRPARTPGRGVRYADSLAGKRPDLVAQLASDRNSPDLDQSRIAARSGKRLWWRCPDCAHVWQAAPHDRPTQQGCPICGQERRSASNRRVDFVKSLAARRPDLVAELHPTRNPDIDPGSLAAGSKQKVWWLCETCGSEWQSDPSTRTRGHGCPACGRRRQAESASYLRARVPFNRSITARRPVLASELHPTRNPDLDPSEMAAYSNRVVWWLCPACGNSWEAAPNARHTTGRCPACRSPASTANTPGPN